MFKLFRCNQQNIILLLLSKTTLNRSVNLASFNNLSYTAHNEPILDYKQGSPERLRLTKKLTEFLSINFTDKSQPLFDIPIIIGDKEIRTKSVKYQLAPFDHKLNVARFYHTDTTLLNEAIESNLSARAQWDNTSYDFRAQVFLFC